MIFIRLLTQTVLLAFGQIWANKVRAASRSRERRIVRIIKGGERTCSFAPQRSRQGVMPTCSDR